VRPVDVNGVNKAAGESYHLLYHSAYGLRTTVLRMTNTYGPGMRIKDARQIFLGIWLRRLIRGEPFEVWGGDQLRDFAYVDDAVDAFIAAALCPATEGRVLNLGGSPPISLRELAQTLVALNGGGTYAVRDFPADRKRIDIGDYYTDDRALRQLTGWAPTTDIETGLRRSLDYYRQNLALYL
jgi:UDP-glucose 4-epimerase